MKPAIGKSLTRNERGQGLTEYLILMLLISVVCIASAKTLGTTVRKKIQEARAHIDSDIVIQ